MHSVVILDLDGTVLDVNSFRHWVVHMVRARYPHLGPGRRLGLALRAGGALAARKAGFIDHERLKRSLQALWKQATEGDGGRSAQTLNRRLFHHVRPEFTRLLSAVAEGRVDAVLATAAVDEYARGLGRMLGVRHVLATGPDRAPHMPSNVGPHKRDAVLNFLDRQGWLDRPRVLFTDHEDDLPLIEVCGTVHWFGTERSLGGLAGRFPDTVLHRGLSSAPRPFLHLPIG
ncbi:HAD family hydrolase [Niveispirillum sp.]|uniref:haloacid dehalogenase-like hydrolase n=1 Tax=Niveispirillum sp. TaxID=1917217 RepID=UPI001B61E2BC|nr:HAD family hydrolase [Niveispirillum sp.]MBP7338870.1 haloacid dehalogenase-like hydrolase [Niveispirillum sp.]